MSGPDKEDLDKSFLARWSQRKREARQLEPRQSEPKQDVPVAGKAEPSGPTTAEHEELAPEFDLSALPKLEELTATTDITAFLRKGVPEHLRNAALRKAWALDPAIRNYVNPALEYAYDWNTPGGLPGSSELGADVDVARLVSQIMGEPLSESSGPIGCDVEIQRQGPPMASVEADVSSKSQQDLPVEALRLGKDANLSENDASGAGPVAQSEAADSVAPQQPLRRHGTAKPIV